MRALALVLALSIATASASAQDAPDESIVAPIEGEPAASRTQREVIERFARLRALRIRYGERHADVVREQMMLVGAERDLLTASSEGAPIDRAPIVLWIRAQIADVDRRLAELSVSCQSGHPDVRTAQARRAAFVEAQRELEARGTFAPRPE